MEITTITTTTTITTITAVERPPGTGATVVGDTVTIGSSWPAATPLHRHADVQLSQGHGQVIHVLLDRLKKDILV